MNIRYNIHDLLKVEIKNASDKAVRDLNLRYHYFEEKGFAPLPADINVAIGRFKPDLSGCFVLDRKFFIKRNYIYVRDSDKGLSWESEISGLEQGALRINFSQAAKDYFRFPWMFFPDLVMEMYVLQPLIEWKLAQKGCLLLHSGAVCKKGKAILVAGRGGSRKTEAVMKLLEKGYDYMSDDLVILDGGRVLSLPLSPGLFTFSYKRAGREDLGFFEQVRLFRFLCSGRSETLPVVDSASVEKVFVIRSVTGGASGVSDLGLEDAVDHLLWNQKMESTSYVSYKYIVGSFLRAYEYVFPEISFAAGLPEIRKRILNAFSAGNVICKAADLDRNKASIALE